MRPILIPSGAQAAGWNASSSAYLHSIQFKSIKSSGHVRRTLMRRTLFSLIVLQEGFESDARRKFPQASKASHRTRFR